MKHNLLNKKYVILPPPNVTGELHCGHFLMTCILDTVSRMNTIILNDLIEICPGTDHGGIAMQVAAIKYYNKNPTENEIITLSNIYKEKIETDLKKWNLCFDWSKNNYTMNEFHYNFVQEVFCKFYEKGYIYKKRSLINWDTGFKTAISDLEVETITQQGILYEIDYKTESGDILKIGTTRPETIFADAALFVNPNDERYKKYINSFAYIPIINKKIPILCDEYVDINFGTGILKVTPGHDIKDYELGLKYKLPIYNILNTENEIIFNELNLTNDQLKSIEPFYKYGYNIYNIRKAMIEILKFKENKITQNIPISSRSREKIEYCMQEQWFMNMEKASKLALNSNVEYLPTNCFTNNIKNWFINIKDWCLSRSLPFGHKLPVWTNKNGEIKVCIENPGEEYIQSNLKLDTWFSSALWPLSYEKQFNIYPFNILVTGYDILFFWVGRMIMVTLLWKQINNEDMIAPFQKVYLHGLVRDSQNRKMSKTLNNVKNPNEEILRLEKLYNNKYGYDILRLSLLLQISPNNNVKILDDPIRARNIITKLINLHYFVNHIAKKTETINDELEKYFEERLQQFYNNIVKFTTSTTLHLVIETIIDYLYEVCDYLVEFYKIKQNLYNILHKSLIIILKSCYSLIPNVINNLLKEMNIEISAIINENYESIQTQHYLIDIIQQLRIFKSLNIEYYYNGDYSDIIKKICVNNCEYNDKLFKILISNKFLYLKIENYEIIKKYIDNKNIELQKIKINNNMPAYIIEKNQIDIKRIEQELNILNNIYRGE